MDRRFFLASAVATSSSLLFNSNRSFAQHAPAIITRDRMRPQMRQGLQSGDPQEDGAIIWTRSDRPARLWLEWSSVASFVSSTKVRGPSLLESSDFTGRVDLRGLPAGQEIFYRVVLQDLHNERVYSEAKLGHLRLPEVTDASALRDVRFVWSGDTAGQGWGINETWGGMRIYEQIRRVNPDFFIHCGDTTYADTPIEAQVSLADGTVWQNVVTEEVSKVAETLDEYRGRYRYNLLDTHVRAMASEVPQIWQWDNHDVFNLWKDSHDIHANSHYVEKSAALLDARAARAFHEYAPLRNVGAVDSERIYRHLPQGPLLDVFVIDQRSYRGPNTVNLQTKEDANSVYLGCPQFRWLVAGLKRSKAIWKVIAANQPISLHVGAGKNAKGEQLFDGAANGDDGKPLGRELEMARLLREIKRAGIQNVVWLTAEVHYTAAHYFDPNHAQFDDFFPFWEFISGPLNAGSYSPNKIDRTFGMQVIYQKAPQQENLPPSSGYQFLGQVDIDARTQAMTVTLKDVNGTALFTKILIPKPVTKRRV